MQQLTDSLSLKPSLLFIKHDTLRLHSVADSSISGKCAFLQCQQFLENEEKCSLGTRGKDFQTPSVSRCTHSSISGSNPNTTLSGLSPCHSQLLGITFQGSHYCEILQSCTYSLNSSIPGGCKFPSRRPACSSLHSQRLERCSHTVGACSRRQLLNEWMSQ